MHDINRQPIFTSNDSDGEHLIKHVNRSGQLIISAKIILMSDYYNAGQKVLRKTGKTASYLKPQSIENSFKRAYGEVEDNIIIYIERLKT